VSELEPVGGAESAAEPMKKKRPSRLRRFFLRHVPLAVAGALVVLVVGLTSLYVWMSSAGFEDFVRRRAIANLESATGGRVQIAEFHWRLLDLEAEMSGLVLHGLEDEGEQPLFAADRLSVKLSILDLFSPRILLRTLALDHPVGHVIVYADGSTNLPSPRPRRTSSGNVLNQFFDMKAGQIAVRNGVLHYENRTSSFDFQDRYQPVDFAANNLSLRLSYATAARKKPESYHIEAGAVDVTIAPGGTRAKTPAVRGYFQCILDLQRTGATLQMLRLTARNHDGVDRSLNVSGALANYNHPHWQAHVTGDLDLRLIEPLTGYPSTPEGIAHLNLALDGHDGGFRIEGPMHLTDASYIGTGVVATGLALDANVHADPKRLLIDDVVVRLRTGGQMEGIVDLAPWLPADAPPTPAVHTANRNVAPPRPPDSIVPMNGRVEAQFKNVTLDTLLDMVATAPYNRLGFDAQVNGSALALWTKGDTNAITVAAKLGLSPSAHAVPGETPTSGVVDGTYTQRDGSVALSKLEVRTPMSQLEAHGQMGAYPMTSATALAVDFRSRNLGEFDQALRDLGVKRSGRWGASALPVALTGMADVHGTWGGSLLNPKIAGTFKASDLALETLPLSTSGSGAAQPNAPPRFLHLDEVDGVGSYSETRIVLDHARLQRGAAHVNMSGSLDAAAARVPSFDANSTLHMKLQTAHLDVADVQPLLGENLPVSGFLNAQVQADGPLHALNGSGWAELVDGVVYGEPVKRLHAQGTSNGQLLHLTSLTAALPAGQATASGSFDLRSHQFQAEATGAGIEVEQLGWAQKQSAKPSGKFGFHAQGSGSLNDPQVALNATLAGFAVAGQPVGSVQMDAHIAHRAVQYDLTARLNAAELTAHGQTGLDGDYVTQTRVDFSRFNIGALLKLAHVQAFTGESSMAGVVTLSGPLAHIDQLHGEAHLQELDATLAGVPLHGEDGLHATLNDGRLHLDPLHLTGENTNLRIGGTLSLKGARALQMASSGSVNLKLIQTIDPDLTASGVATFQVEAHGPLDNPNLQGQVDFLNGSLALENVPNSLSQLHGTLLFSQNRLEVKSLTALSGGGLLSFGGSLSYQNGLYANLTATGKGIRIRYPQGVSSLADGSLRLQGPQNNLQLAGDVLITRFNVSPDLDVAALAAQTSAVHAPAAPNAPSNHVRLDVHITSSPQLNFQNAFAKLAGDVDLRLRGTLATPTLLGRISITEGTATIAGTRYELQRGEIVFNNPVRIEPSIDLNAMAHVEDYDITLGLHGTTEKMGVSYHSDPPLPEADVVALLALGRTENQQRLYTQQQQQALSNPTTDALLGGALNATVSNRVQKLFGAGSVKVDPNYLGALGNSTSRIIVESQLGRNLTLTYATNVNTTGQQLIQAEVAINRHVSLVMARDESGVFSMVLKATRRYR
jgi:translocation and assembly module TamB